MEANNPYVRTVEVTEDDTDPAKWGINWPKEYDSYKLTALPTRTRFGGHGGSESLPQEKTLKLPPKAFRRDKWGEITLILWRWTTTIWVL